MSSSWVKQSVTPSVDTRWQELKYGFKWWLYPRKEPGEFVWMGIGFGGQRLMVFPREQLIATFTGWDIIKDPAVDVNWPIVSYRALLPLSVETLRGELLPRIGPRRRLQSTG